MRQSIPVLVALIMLISVGFVPDIAQAEDDWPDSCEDAPTVDPSGNYSVTMDTPNDYDMMKLELEKGDFLYVSFIVPEGYDSFQFGKPERTYDNRVSITDVQNADSHEDDLNSIEPGEQVSAKFWAEESGTATYCFYAQGGEQNLPYTVNLKFRLNSPGPASFDITDLKKKLESQKELLQKKNRTISSLREELHQKERRAQSMATLLEQKNQTISDLEARIEELKSETPRSSDSDITIRVIVNPEDGQNNFIEGSKAIVRAKSKNAELGQIEVQFGPGTYQLNSSGMVAIPLADSGTQTMGIRYGNLRKEVTINVKPSEGNQQTSVREDAEQDSTTTTDAFVPGFTAIGTILALLGVSSLLLHRLG